MDLAVWLRGLGLGKYEAIFRENDIDEAVLPSLTHENLKELGVASFGHRVKLLDAIAALRNEASVKTPTVDAATASSTLSPRPEDRAERRQVTVMFSDLGDRRFPRGCAATASSRRTLRGGEWKHHRSALLARPLGLVAVSAGASSVAARLRGSSDRSGFESARASSPDQPCDDNRFRAHFRIDTMRIH
jgi:hypothetical protein